AILKLLSALSGGTCRSSPKKNWILLHGTIARSGPLFSSKPYSVFGVEPPARATEKESFKQTASRAASTNSAAAVCAMALASDKILISRLVIVVVIVGIAVVIFSVHPGGRPLHGCRNLSRLRRHVLFSDRSPRTSIARQQLIGFCRPPASGRIVRKRFSSKGGPDIEHWLNHVPTRLNHIRTLEQRRIPDHAVMQKPFVSGAVRRPKVAGIVELHVHEAQAYYRARNFSAESQRNSFVGLNVNDQTVRLQVSDLSLPKQHKRGPPKLDSDFGCTLLQALARPQVERHAGPAPIVDMQFQ